MSTNATPRRRSPSRSGGSSGTAKAAAKAVESGATELSLPLVGTVRLPSKGSLAYYGAITGLAALGLIEWPVAAVVALGHLLAQQQGNAIVKEFGEGLDDA